MGHDKFDPNNLLKKLQAASNAANKPHFSSGYEEIQVNISPDNSISQGKFKPDLLKPGHFKAHPVTIRAMRKDLFTAGNDEFLDLEKSYTCQSCKTPLDLQFWQFCPYCEQKFSADI